MQGIEPYFTEYDGKEDEEEMIQFWRQVIYEFTYAVSFEFTLNPKQLVKQFTMYNRRPSGLPAIMQVLHQRK